MLDSYNNRVTPLFVFVFLFIFFSIDFLALCFFQQPVSLFLVGALSRLLLISSPVLLLSSMFLLVLHVALLGLAAENFMFFLLISCFLGFLLKKTVYNTSLLQLFFSCFMVLFYGLMVEQVALFSFHNLIIFVFYLISGLFAARFIGSFHE